MDHPEEAPGPPEGEGSAASAAREMSRACRNARLASAYARLFATHRCEGHRPLAASFVAALKWRSAESEDASPRRHAAKPAATASSAGACDGSLRGGGGGGVARASSGGDAGGGAAGGNALGGGAGGAGGSRASQGAFAATRSGAPGAAPEGVAGSPKGSRAGNEGGGGAPPRKKGEGSEGRVAAAAPGDGGGDPSGGDPRGGDPSGSDPSGGDPSCGDPSGAGGFCSWTACSGIATGDGGEFCDASQACVLATSNFVPDTALAIMLPLPNIFTVAVLVLGARSARRGSRRRARTWTDRLPKESSHASSTSEVVISLSVFHLIVQVCD